MNDGCQSGTATAVSEVFDAWVMGSEVAWDVRKLTGSEVTRQRRWFQTSSRHRITQFSTLDSTSNIDLQASVGMLVKP